MAKTLEEVEGMNIPRGELIEIVTGEEVRPVYFAGVDKSAVSYYERVIKSMDDIRTKPYLDTVLLENIDSIIFRVGWGIVK